MHWSTIIRNVFSNWASYVVTAIVGFCLAPLVVHSLGNTGYGLWTLVISLTGYFGLLDLGIRSSVGRFIARSLALHDEERLNRYVSTAFLILGAGGILALGATLTVIAFFFGSFKVEAGLVPTGKMALLLAGLNVACVLPLGAFSSVLIALERFDLLSGVNIVGELIRAALVVTALRLGYGLIGLAVITLVLTALQYSVIAFFAKSLHPSLRLSWKLVNTVTFKELFGFGVLRFIWIVANQLIFYSDSVVIGIFLSAGAITFFAIAGSLVNYVRNVVSLLTDTFYPSATRMDAKQDFAGLQNLLILGTRLAVLVALPLCLGLIFLGKQFIVLWMGKAYASSAVYLTVLIIPQLTATSQYVSALILAGMAKHKVLAYLALAEGLVNLVLSVVLVQRIGLIGVAWGTVIPDIICTAVIVPWYTLRVLGMNFRDYAVKVFVRPLIAACPAVLLGYVFWSSVQDPSWLVFGVEAIAMAGLFGVISYFLCLTVRQRMWLRGRVSTIFHREIVSSEA